MAKNNKITKGSKPNADEWEEVDGNIKAYIEESKYKKCSIISLKKKKKERYYIALEKND